MASGTPRHGQRPRRACGHAVEGLEERLVLSGLTIAYKIVTDRADWMGAPANLEGTMNARFGSEAWRREIARAVQTWAEAINVDFAENAEGDSSQPTDILIGGQDLGSGLLGLGYLPTKSGGKVTNYGDLVLNTSPTINIGKNYDLYSVALHEFGHAIGLEHTDQPGVVMNPVYQGVLSGLTPSDLSAIQALYGPRQPDRFNSQGRGTSVETAVDLALNSPLTEVNDLDITRHGETDVFSFIAPGGSLKATVGVAGESLLSPQLRILDANGRVVGQASDPASYGDDVSLDLSGLVAGQRYYLEVSGASPNNFDIGGYDLEIRGSGSVQVPTTPPPTTPPTPPVTPPVRPQIPTGPAPGTGTNNGGGTPAPGKPSPNPGSKPNQDPASWRFAARQRAVESARAALAARLELREANRPFARFGGRALGAFSGLHGRLG